jgi:RHS repeat-associated protein
MAFSPTDGYLHTLTGPMPSHTTTYARDLLGRPLSITGPDAQSVGVGYDAMGRTGSITPPGRAAHGFSYSPVGLLTQYAAPALELGGEATVTQSGYDLERRPTAIARPDGRTIGFSYDPVSGRRESMTSPTRTVQYEYHPTTGKVSALRALEADGEHVLSFVHDGMLPTSTTWSGDGEVTTGTVSRAYNRELRLSSLSLNGEQVAAYSYDRDGLLVSAGPMSLQRDFGNGLLTGTAVGALTTQDGWTGFAEQSEHTASFGGALLYRNELLQRDKLGRITERRDTVSGSVATHAYEYDLAGRLSRTVKNGTQQAQYTYDANGNRLTKVTALGTIVGRYDAQDRLLRYCPEDAGGAAQPIAGLPCNEYQYRASGELLQRTDLANGGAEWDYDYDEHGALREVVLPDGRVVRYEIDAAGRRVGKRIDGVKQWGLLYQDALRPIAMLDASNNVTATFVYGTRSNVPDYMVKGGQTYRFVVDHVGSVRMVVSVASGAVVQRLDYDAFGEVLSDTNPGWQPFGFAGGLYDADTELVRFGARDYDAVSGRWTAKDPILFGGRQPNLYAYCYSDPVNYFDRTGLDAASILELVGGTVILGAGAVAVAAGTAISLPAVAVGATILGAGLIVDYFDKDDSVENIDDAKKDIAPIRDANEDRQDTMKQLQKDGDWPDSPDDPEGEIELRKKLRAPEPFCP